jgi:hypothetical protein
MSQHGSITADKRIGTRNTLWVSLSPSVALLLGSRREKEPVLVPLGFVMDFDSSLYFQCMLGNLAFAHY